MVTNTLPVLTHLVLTTNDVGAIILKCKLRKLNNKEVNCFALGDLDTQ